MTFQLSITCDGHKAIISDLSYNSQHVACLFEWKIKHIKLPFSKRMNYGDKGTRTILFLLEAVLKSFAVYTVTLQVI